MEATAYAPAASLFDRMVDRYLDVTSWPPARKTALLMGIALPFHLALLGFSLVALRSPETPIQVDGFVRAQLAFLAAIAATFAVAWWADRRGSEARWTAYLMMATYGLPVAVLIHLQGTWSTPWIVFHPLALLLLVLFYDERIGAAGIAFGTLVLLGISVLELTGVLPYAPLFRERGIEAPLRVPWVATQAAFVGLAFFYYASVLRFSEAARERQRARLELAHRELAEARARLERGNDLIRRYLPSQLAEELLRGSHTGAERPERRKVTVLCSDVEGFTEIADRLEPEELAGRLDEYLGEMARIADQHGGTVEHFVGDGITVLFGAPLPAPDLDHASRAVRAAVAMQARVAELERAWFEAGLDVRLRVRIGINTGVASVGSFGSAGRKTYSAVGTQTNLAARLEAECPPGGVLASHATWALVRDEFEAADRGETRVKGIHFPVRRYEILGLRPAG